MSQTIIANLNTLVAASAVQFKQELTKAQSIANFGSGAEKAMAACVQISFPAQLY
jgi:hypothetical protein